MEAHLTADDIARYRGRQMAPAEVRRVREHADSCEECRAGLAQAASGAAVMRALIDTEPDEQELVLFAAGRLSPERAAEIEGHLAGCAACQEAVEDLRAFLTRARPRLPRPLPPS